MAIFGPSDYERLDYQILQNGGLVLYWRPAYLAEDLGWLEAHGYLSRQFPCESWKTESDFHRDVAQSLRFPSYYGSNLDAFNDSLSEIDVPLEGGTVLVLNRFDEFASKERKTAEAMLDIIATNSRWYLLEGRRLVCLVQSDDPRLALSPVGASPVVWNPREWLDASRK